MPFDNSTYIESSIYTLDSLIAWLETKPQDEVYDFMDCKGGCLIGQYLTDKIGKSWRGDWLNVQYDFRLAAAKWDVTYYYLHGKLAPKSHQGYTFGAALKRAQTLRAAAPLGKIPPFLG